MMRRRAKRIREGQARERKKEGKPAYFGAHVKRTRFRNTGLVKRNGARADLATSRVAPFLSKLGKRGGLWTCPKVRVARSGAPTANRSRSRSQSRLRSCSGLRLLKKNIWQLALVGGCNCPTIKNHTTNNV